MDIMRKIHLTIITENQNSKIKAKKLGHQIENCNGNFKLISIEKYFKNENSFQIDFEILLDSEKNNFMNEILVYANKIVTPWLVYYKSNMDAELIFKKDELSRFREDKFNVISWMHIQCD